MNRQRVDSLRVPEEFSSLWYWSNTQVAALEPREVYSTFPGLLGHEWDEDLDNGYRLEGLIRLSDTIVDNVQYIQDHGSVFDTGTGRHRLTLYKKNNAIVFGASTGTLFTNYNVLQCNGFSAMGMGVR